MNKNAMLASEVLRVYLNQRMFREAELGAEQILNDHSLVDRNLIWDTLANRFAKAGVLILREDIRQVYKQGFDTPYHTQGSQDFILALKIVAKKAELKLDMERFM